MNLNRRTLISSASAAALLVPMGAAPNMKGSWTIDDAKAIISAVR